MGALNTIREIGLATGLLVLLIDVAKGAGAVLIARALGVSPIWIYLAGFMAVVGHCWPVFLKFRGGKGAATTMGVYLALAPPAFACCIPVLLAVIFFTSNVTLGLAAGIALFPLFLWIFGYPVELIVYAILTAIFLGLRYLPTAHRGMKKADGVKDFIIEKNYKPWQTRKTNSRNQERPNR